MELCWLGILLLELLNSSSGIDQLLLTGEEWVTTAADFHANFRVYRTGFEFVPAGTNDVADCVRRVNIRFHLCILYMCIL